MDGDGKLLAALPLTTVVHSSAGVAIMVAVRILLAGDWHGNRAWARTCFEAAAAHGCDAVLQLGDFGLWPGREDEWLDHVDGLAGAAGAPLVWIDGNHENHAALQRWRAGADRRGLVQMRRHVQWATRGARWEWAGVRFGAVGGAVSIDRFLRRPGVNWWPEEAVTQADVDRLGDGPLDVLATHAAPSTPALPYRRLPLPPSIIADARQVRSLLDQAVGRTRPALVVHGHYHARLHAVTDGRAVEGLAHDRSSPQEAMAVLDLAAGAALQLRPLSGGPDAADTPDTPDLADRADAPDTPDGVNSPDGAVPRPGRPAAAQ